MSIILRVEHPDGTIYTYTDAEIEANGEPTIETEAGVDAVHVGDLELVLDSTFLDAEEIDELPVPALLPAWSIYYRAEVVEVIDEVEQVRLNGVIHRVGGITHVPETESWIVVVEDDAAERFLESLDIDLGEHYSAIADAQGTLGLDFVLLEYQTSLPWYLLADFLLCAISLTPHVWDGPDDREMLGQRVVYEEGGVEKTYLHKPLIAFTLAKSAFVPVGFGGLRGHTARQLFDAVAAMRAWRLLVAYETFPDRTIVAGVVLDHEDDEAAALEIDDLLVGAPDGRDGETPHRLVPGEIADLAFAYANRLSEEGSSAGEGEDTIFMPHPDAIRAAAGTLRLDADGKVENDDLVTLPFRFPSNSQPLPRLLGTVTPDPVNHPNLSFIPVYTRWSVFYDWEEEDTPSAAPGLYLTEFIEADDFANHHQLLFRSFWDATGGTMESVEATRTPAAFLAHYDVSVRESVETEVLVDASEIAPGSWRCGDPSKPVELDGYRWVVMRESYNLDTQTARLTLRRAAGEAPSSPGGGGGSTTTQPAVSGSYDCSDYDEESDEGMEVTFEWTEPADPADEFGAVDHYEYEIREPGDSYGATQATEDDETLSVDLEGGVGTWSIRVRAVYGDGEEDDERSAWGAASVNAQPCAPDTVQGLRVVTVGADFVSLAWNPFEPEPDGYVVQYGTTEGGPYPGEIEIEIAELSSPASPTWTVSGLTAEPHYFVIDLLEEE